MRAMVIVGWAGFAGCAGDDEASTPGDFSPTLEFLAPADGASVAAGDVQVSIVVDDFALTAPDAQARSGLGSPGPLWLSLLPQALAHNEGGLPRGVLAQSGLEDTPHDDFLDLGRIDARPLDGGANGDAAQIGRLKRRE